MKNISFDNPYLLLIAIPLALLIVIPFFIVRNKDNKSALWSISTVLHVVIIALVMVAVAGISSETLLTETTIYVVADVSHSSERNLDEIDEYIAEIKENLPEKTKLGVVCFGKDSIVLAKAGRTIGSVKDVELNDTGTNIAGALNFTEKLFEGDSLKRIILITDGNDTTNSGSGAIASTVERLTGDGIRIDAIFLDNTLRDDQTEIQLLEPSLSSTAYTDDNSEVTFLVQSSIDGEFTLELYSRPKASQDEEAEEFTFLADTVVLAEKGLNTVRMKLPTDNEGTFEYKAVVKHADDIADHNNERIFVQTVVGDEKILLITGTQSDKQIVEQLYEGKGIVETYVVSSGNNRVPFTVEQLMEYDEIVISNVDIRNINNANAFVDSLDSVVSQYGKSLITLGDLNIQSNPEDTLFKKFSELLPIDYGKTAREGKLYTILLDVSDSMFMASKFFAAQEAAVKLLSVLDENDYVCLITFSGDIKVDLPRKVGECKDELVSKINGLSTSHGTDVALGLEEALKTIRSMNLEENQIMVISDGFSFDSTVVAVDVAKDLYEYGAVISGIVTYIPSDGNNGKAILSSIVNAGKGGKLYEVRRPEDVAGVLFGSVSTDMSESVINKTGTVNIVKYNDGIVNNIDSFPQVAGFITSLQKYDATVPLTITYNKNNIRQETVPLYAYRPHGNGKVVSFTSNLSGSWTSGWTSEEKGQFVENLFVSNTPKEKHDYPYTISLERTELDMTLDIMPTILDPSAKVVLNITYPNGAVIRTIKRTLAFDKNKYTYNMQTSSTGIYNIDISYTYQGITYTSNVNFEIPYVKEYDEFVTCDRFNVYKFMREFGTITENGIPSLENDKNDISTYKVSYRAPFIIAAAALFVVDIFLRKLKIKKKTNKVKAR